MWIRLVRCLPRRLRDFFLDRALARGYKRFPDDTAVAKAQAAMLAEVLPDETW